MPPNHPFYFRIVPETNQRAIKGFSPCFFHSLLVSGPVFGDDPMHCFEKLIVHLRNLWLRIFSDGWWWEKKSDWWLVTGAWWWFGDVFFNWWWWKWWDIEKEKRWISNAWLAGIVISLLKFGRCRSAIFPVFVGPEECSAMFCKPPSED